MSLHKLTAGDGYTYLTRQVAAHDDTHRGRDGLAAYYADKGEAPEVWLGAAATGRNGFPAAGEAVGEAQMVALFGEGRHPKAEQIEAELSGTGLPVRAVLAATRLGRSYRTRHRHPRSGPGWQPTSRPRTPPPGAHLEPSCPTRSAYRCGRR